MIPTHWAFDRFCLAEQIVPSVCHIGVTESTIYRWIRRGLNGVKLDGGTAGWIVTSPGAVIHFVYDLNDMIPHFDAYLLDEDHFPRPIEEIATTVLGYDVDQKTIQRWRKVGVNGNKLVLMKLGRFRLVTKYDFEQFAKAAALLPQAKGKKCIK